MTRQSNFHSACSDSLRVAFRQAWGNRFSSSSTRSYLQNMPDLSDKIMQAVVARANGDLLTGGFDPVLVQLVLNSGGYYYGCGGDQAKIDWRQIYKDDLDGTDSNGALGG